ncbi:MAG TPA: hypothetical protein VIX37_22980, partial [Candidatus Sulfotelmatobacter sp.]
MGDSGLLGAIGRSMAMKRQRAQEKEAEQIQQVMENLYAYTNPSIQSDMENAHQNLIEGLQEIFGPTYKEHEPGILHGLHNVGNAVLGSFGLQLPQKGIPAIPVSRGQPQQTGQTGIDRNTGLPTTRLPSGLIQRGAQPQPQAGAPATSAPGAPGDSQQGALQTLAQGPAAGEPAALPGSATPPSTLANAAPTGISPASLTTGTTPTPAMTRQDQLNAGGRAIGKGGNAPILMPLSQDAIMGGQLQTLALRGKLGPGFDRELADYAMGLQRQVLNRTIQKEDVPKLLREFVQRKMAGGTAATREALAGEDKAFLWAQNIKAHSENHTPQENTVADAIIGKWKEGEASRQALIKERQQ